MTLLDWMLQNVSGPVIFFGAIWTILQWIKPRAEDLLSGHISLVGNLNKGWSRTNELIPILVSFLKENQRRLHTQHNTLLIIEDSPTQRFAIESSMVPIARKFGLNIVAVDSIEDAIPLVYQSRIIILDVILQDTGHPDTTQIFVQLVTSPVVVYTGTEDLSQLFGLDVIKKSDADGISNLVERVDQILGTAS